MPSSIFGSQGGNSAISAINAFKSMVNGNPQGAFDQMYNANPQFRRFADSMKGKTPEQAFKENGLDFSQFKNIM